MGSCSSNLGASVFYGPYDIQIISRKLQNQQQSDPTLRCCQYVALCQTLWYPLPSLTQTLISSAVIRGPLVLIKSLINYLGDQKFSGPLFLRQTSIAANPFKLNIYTSVKKQTWQSKDIYPVATNAYTVCTHSHSETCTDSDEAKLEYKCGGGWLVCSLWIIWCPGDSAYSCLSASKGSCGQLA